MIIQHNLEATFASGINKKNEKIQAKHSERLASGRKINTAADDAASLVISQKMRSQIRGLNQAAINVEDGKNLTDIADGAMGEMCSILQRMNELCVQAANGTSSESDKEKIQNEIAALTSEINKIANETNYNTINLFDGSISGDYSYSYGLLTGPVKTTPAIIEASDGFTPFSVDYGTQASFSSAYVDLTTLESNGFPVSGTFTITIADPERTDVTATIDFGTVNADGSFTAADFVQYFQNKFDNPADGLGRIATVSLNNGKLEVITEAKGGNASTISLSGTAYSAVIGTYNGTAVNSHYSFLSGTSYPDLDAFWNDIKTNLAGQSNTFQWWSQEYVGTNLVDKVSNTVTIDYSSYGSISQLQSALNAAGLTIFQDRTGNIGISPTSPYSNIPTPFGYNTFVPNRVSIEGGTNAFTQLFGNNTDRTNNANGCHYSGISSPPSLTSSYEAQLSDYSGILEISIGGPYAAGTCTIDFSQHPLSFLNNAGIADTNRSSPAALAALVDYINQELNKTPPAVAATHPQSASGYEVATASINAAGRLVITPTERGGYVNVIETYSDKPIYDTYYHMQGNNLSANLYIKDDIGNETAVTIAPRNEPYSDLDDFINDNWASFSSAGFTIENINDKLVITSIGTGVQHTVDSLRTNPLSLLASLGLDSAAFTDGTTTTISKDDPEYSYNGLWIQCGANSGEHVDISIPRINAYELGLTITSTDLLNPAAYNGISTIGTENYSDVPNVEGAFSLDIEYGINVLSDHTATNAIRIVNNALSIISSERASIGAMYNRLDSIGATIGISSENLTVANSGIEDADMAKEYVELSKCNILSQTANSMIAQANSIRNNVVELLKI